MTGVVFAMRGEPLALLGNTQGLDILSIAVRPERFPMVASDSPLAEGTLLSGALWSLDGFIEGWIEIASGKVGAVGFGVPPRSPDHEGWIVPPWVDGHTHLGDRGLRGSPQAERADLATLVAPPNGVKHRYLTTTPRSDLVEQAARFLSECCAGGTGWIWDFRESALQGQQILWDALAAGGQAPYVHAYYRPEAFAGTSDYGSLPTVPAAVRSRTEIAGVHLSSVSDHSPEELDSFRRWAAHLGAPVALHFCEGHAEPLSQLEILRPVRVIHLTHADRASIRAVRRLGSTVVLCVRSNARFGIAPDLRPILEEGIRPMLGTDNAFLHEPVFAEEVGAFLRLAARQGLDPHLAWRAIDVGWNDQVRAGSLPWEVGAPAQVQLYPQWSEDFVDDLLQGTGPSPKLGPFRPLVVSDGTATPVVSPT